MNKKDANTKRGERKRYIISIEYHNSIHNIQKIIIMQFKNMVSHHEISNETNAICLVS